MLIEETISDSFNLDFEILKNFTLNEKLRFYSPNLKTVDIFQEFESYVKETKDNFCILTKIFETCNEQRKHFRIAIIKLLKDKSLLDKLIVEDKNELVSQKINIHDELRIKIIDKLNDKIDSLYKLNKDLEDENKNLWQILKNSPPRTLSNNSNLKKKHQKHHSINNIPIDRQSKEKKNELYKIISSSKNPKDIKDYVISRTIDTSAVDTSLSSCTFNRLNHNEQFDKEFKNLPDFNSEKYNKISSSPIQTPKNFHNKINLFDTSSNINLQFNLENTNQSRLYNFKQRNINRVDDYNTIDNNIGFETSGIQEDLFKNGNDSVSRTNIENNDIINKIPDFKKKIICKSNAKDNYIKSFTQRNFDGLRKSINFNNDPKKKTLDTLDDNTKHANKRSSFHLKNKEEFKNQKKKFI